MKLKRALVFCLTLFCGSAALYGVAAQWLILEKPQRNAASNKPLLAQPPPRASETLPKPPPASLARKEIKPDPSLHSGPASILAHPARKIEPAAVPPVPLEFRGLKIGMTKSEVEQVVSQSLFKRMGSLPVGPNGMILLTCERGIQGDEFLELARTATGKVYSWELVGVLFEQDKTSSLGITSPTFTTADFDGPLRDWTAAVLAALMQKWGVPTYARRDPVNIFNVRHSRGAKVAEWNLGPDSRIDFSIMEKADGGYIANVLYSNPAVADAVAHRNKAVKGSF